MLPARMSLFINYTFNLSEFNHVLDKMREKDRGDMTKTTPETVWRILLAVTQWGVGVRQQSYLSVQLLDLVMYVMSN